MPRILTLTSDFGTTDAYVASMKGVVLGICPEATMIDVSHGVSSQDIMEAAFVLRNAIPYFPKGTVHLAVVDPGVGTKRKAVALEHDGCFFVGPDNGLFDLVLDGAVAESAVELDRPQFFRASDPSPTFHGRNVFAAVAAHLLNGVPITSLGSPVRELARLHWVQPTADDQGVRGWVIHLDRFGNCITNISRELIDRHSNGRQVKCYAGTSIMTGIDRTYASVAPGEPVALFSSDGYLEIAVNCGHAADLLGIRKGAGVSVVFLDKRPG